VQPGRRAANLGRALELMERAGDLEPSPDLIVFPECMDLGLGEHAPPLDMVEPLGGPFGESLAEKARDLGVYVAAGLTERQHDRLFSCAVLMDPDGDTILHHRRITVGPHSGSYLSPGDTLHIRRTPLGSLALLAGTDVWKSALIGALSLMGAEVIIAPAGFSTEKDSAAAIKTLISKMTWPAAKTAPSVLSVAPASPAGEAGKPRNSACAFRRDPAGNLALLNESGIEQMICMEV
ncbi:MAG: carbon-nitrogen hydrolase family protein, partial [Phycisphaerales bacterium]